MRLMILAVLTAFLAVPLATSPAEAKCSFNICAGERAKLLDSQKLRVGDIYNPGHGRRLQIRDKNLRVLGYIESSGKITDRRRRKVGSIEGLGLGAGESTQPWACGSLMGGDVCFAPRNRHSHRCH